MTFCNVLHEFVSLHVIKECMKADLKTWTVFKFRVSMPVTSLTEVTSSIFDLTQSTGPAHSLTKLDSLELLVCFLVLSPLLSSHHHVTASQARLFCSYI